jgi:hypothetical protein
MKRSAAQALAAATRSPWPAAAVVAARAGPLARHLSAAAAPVAAAAERTAAAAPAKKEAYGAPFTNSVRMAPLPPPADAPTYPAPPDVFRLTLAVPGLREGHVDLFARDSLAHAGARVAEVTGASAVGFVRNGVPVASPEARLVDLFDGAVDVTLDGLRYNVNAGLVLTPRGAAAKRSLAMSYAFVAVGGAVTFAAAFWLWNRLLPRENNKLKQLFDSDGGGGGGGGGGGRPGAR